MKITPHELRMLRYTSLEMQDGSGYLATLGVYHEIHCVVSSQAKRKGERSAMLTAEAETHS
jgi:hypothetical protein